MVLTYDDVDKLVQALSAQAFEHLEFSCDGLTIQVDRVRQVQPVATKTEPPQPSPNESAAQPIASVGAVRVTTPAVGRVYWADGRPPPLGAHVAADSLLASIETETECTQVIPGISGEISFVQAFEDGDFVSYGQLLLVLESCESD